MKFQFNEFEQLGERINPVVHSFSAATTHSDSDNAGGSPTANAVVRLVHGSPAPVVVGGQNCADNAPPAIGFVLGRFVNPQ
jgi:hypothetical protein